MLFYECKFCGKNEAFPFSLITKKLNFEYFHCGFCGGISLSEKNYLSVNEQIVRYQSHHNELTDLGYTKFLCDFLMKTFSFLPNYDGGLIVDYGSGPTPALLQLLNLVSKKQDSRVDFCYSTDFSSIENLQDLQDYVNYLSVSLPPLPSREGIVGWDPFFSPDTALKDGQAALVLCLEVAEHFERPLEGFAGLAASCSVSGYVAVGTLPIPDNMSIPDGFKGWWYKDDRTHVSFYTEEAIKSCGRTCGLKYLGKASPRIFIFQKLGDAES